MVRDEEMTNLTRDDLRAAVGMGIVSESQAATMIALARARGIERDRVSGPDEPFELYRGFNEIFIVVGLGILFGGWWWWVSIESAIFASRRAETSDYLLSGFLALVHMGSAVALAWYFTLHRRMVAPSIALSICFFFGAWLMGHSIGKLASGEPSLYSIITWGAVTLLLAGYYYLFRVPFTLAQVALGIFATAFAAVTLGGTTPELVRDYFLLSEGGPFAILTIILGFVFLFVAMRFDIRDPHRVTRRAASGFWLHVVAAPAIVNTVALTLYEQQSAWAQLLLLIFVLLMAFFAIIIDRRSFLIAGAGYVAVLSLARLEDGWEYLGVSLLGLVLVSLGAIWEAFRRRLMRALPEFPGKSRLPPWKSTTAAD